MRVRDLIEVLKTKDPDAIVVEHGVRGHSSQYDSINVVVDNGFWLTDEPNERHGIFINKDMAERVQEDGQTLLDFTADTVQKAVKIHWSREERST